MKVTIQFALFCFLKYHLISSHGKSTPATAVCQDTPLECTVKIVRKVVTSIWMLLVSKASEAFRNTLEIMFGC